MSSNSHAARMRSNSFATMMQAAERYIQYDKSDPFTRGRIHSHIVNGIATPMRASRCNIEKYKYDDHGKAITPAHGEQDAYYDVEFVTERREYTNGKGDTAAYNVTSYKNMVRP